MANYPQLDNARGVWNLREVYDAVMGGYWPNYNSIALSFHGFNGQKIIGKNIISTAGNSTAFGDQSVSKTYLGSGTMSSFTRGIVAGGYPSTQINLI